MGASTWVAIASAFIGLVALVIGGIALRRPPPSSLASEQELRIDHLEQENEMLLDKVKVLNADFERCQEVNTELRNTNLALMERLFKGERP